MRWHDILRVLDDYRVCAVRVKQHEGEAYVPNGTLGGAPKGTRPSLPMEPNDRDSFWETNPVNESSRTDTSDWDWFLQSVSIILLCVLLIIVDIRASCIAREFR